MYRQLLWLVVPLTLACGGCEDARNLVDFSALEAASSDTQEYTLSWVSPIEYEDGTPLIALAGFRIYANNDLILDIDLPGVFTASINGTPGDRVWMTAYSSDGVESLPSDTVVLP